MEYFVLRGELTEQKNGYVNVGEPPKADASFPSRREMRRLLLEANVGFRQPILESKSNCIINIYPLDLGFVNWFRRFL